jgi:hypothetical protein
VTAGGGGGGDSPSFFGEQVSQYKELAARVAAGGNKRSLGAKAPEIALRYIFLYPPSLYTRRRPDQTSGLEMHRPRFSKESSLAVARQSPSSA